jgi:branched-chain amino acid aminotransferase
LYIADEMFLCGTAAEVSAVNSVDDRPIPCPGPMTTAIADEFRRAVRGQVDRYKEWVEDVG